MYRLNENASVIRDADGAQIPPYPANIDWQAYQAWRAAGNEPSPILPPAPTIPQVVTRRQAMLALLAAGKLDAVDLAIQNAPRVVQITWSTAAEFERTNPLIEALAPQLGLTEVDIDNLFIEAGKL